MDDGNRDRLLATSLTARWTYGDTALPFDATWRLVRETLLRSFAEHDSESVQHTLRAMGRHVLDNVEAVAFIMLVMPNTLHLPVDLSRFGLENRNEIFVATGEPFGVIEGTLRDDPGPALPSPGGDAVSWPRAERSRPHHHLSWLDGLRRRRVRPRGRGTTPVSTTSTHVLDTSAGIPAAGVAVRLERASGDVWEIVGSDETDADGRVRTLVASGRAIDPGSYRLTFDTQAYFDRGGTPTFYPSVVVVFRMADAAAHYHVPLLVSPWGYATYRGT